LAVAIQERFGLSAEMIKSSGGVFEVEVDGVLVFSKKATGRFPENEEIFSAISSRIED